jgi:hypothetical protein
MNESFDQHSAHTPSAPTGSRHEAHSFGKARSSAAPKRLASARRTGEGEKPGVYLQERPRPWSKAKADSGHIEA